MTVENLKSMLSPDSQRHYIDESTVQAYEAPLGIQMAAHVLVSERHGKFDLIHLVAYLMGQAASADRDAARYRWLRATTNHVTRGDERIDIRNCPDEWDHAIDSALAEEDK